jgi:hypothetical protein
MTLEVGVMHDFVQLDREQVVDLRDAGVDHGLGIPRHRHGALEHLVDEFLHQVLAPLPRGGIHGQLALFDDLIQQPQFLDLLLGLGLLRRGGC